LGREAFAERFRARFHDPAFASMQDRIEELLAVAWDAYEQGRKAPRTHPAGPGYADPDYELSDQWREASRQVAAAQDRQKRADLPTRILLVNASPRSEHTCPGEMSKSWRLLEAARAVIEADGAQCDVLDLSLIPSQYGRHIHPCKACVSTSMALCHWPCSCYPNHALGQTQDWMHEIYPRWAAAHGVLIVTPVHWNQAPSVLKLMMDRLVCADGGNPDPTSTHGKDPAAAKALELKGWDYPRHLAGRAFGLVVHGDSEGAQLLRHALADWLTGMGLVAAPRTAQLDRYIGYYEPYATSHEALDNAPALFEEVRNTTRALLEQTRRVRAGGLRADAGLHEPRPK
ncbi:MAG TPA: flavodoxin family protein, partial [Rhodanobacteraceae bacterium]|nr:flavodoxin family protein [Rhodanobacteraceae bacterium]